MDKYTVLKPSRLGETGDILELHPRQATFLLTEQLVVKGELKGKALQDHLSAAQIETTKTGSNDA